ncbi:aldehyde dehydrogenase [Evansella cellulosilytica]|uniref:Aldehyde dehydrogenase n=1 Tax=Evansella cellulosilytica (strain ATCC 21833 / DSM 2522 / FERM P-1141 / JCM 9156 / N-4) TaxID=649639 RepID=E6U061_EVAC2|nr:aldehyde dehydrogenase [Evansella cellulosilytica]ADU29065.1 Aldehyde Dehydrogenase [Evansella cellulosilytica DSM 2522]
MNEAIHSLVEAQRKYFHTGETIEVKFRQRQLARLRDVIQKREQDIIEAINKDLNKSEHEIFLTELSIVYNEIKDMLKNVDFWATPKKERTPFTHLGSKSYIYKHPYGVTAIIAPWNYPFQLAIAPLIGAIGAGNTAILKPSELTPYTSSIIRELIAETFDEKYVAVVEGDTEASKDILKEKLDYIFFTGSVQVGKEVMKAAANHLTPVTLELGGKNPAIIMDDANVKLAAKRIVWGKFINAGQTCVAPDYILVYEKKRRKLLKYIGDYIKKLYGPDTRFSKDYPKIVTPGHVDRLVSLLDQDKVYYGGSFDRDERFMEPTVMVDVEDTDLIMEEEIFGPILPVLTFSTEYEVIERIRKRPNPLALYLFTNNKSTEEYFIENLQFGGGCVNDTLMHVGTPYLPFGGVGESGIGAYHGKYSFDTFTHEKSIVKQTTKFDVPLRYSKSKSSLKALRKMTE